MSPLYLFSAKELLLCIAELDNVPKPICRVKESRDLPALSSNIVSEIRKYKLRDDLSLLSVTFKIVFSA